MTYVEFEVFNIKRHFIILAIPGIRRVLFKGKTLSLAEMKFGAYIVSIVFFGFLIASESFKWHSASGVVKQPRDVFIDKIVVRSEYIKISSNLQMSSFAEENDVLDVVASTNVDSVKPVSSGFQHDLSPQQFVYVVLSCLFVTCLIIADVIGVKLFNIPLPFSIFGYKAVEHTCGMLTFPVTFLLGDIINEYYGPQAAKNTVYIGLAMSVLVFLVMNVAQAMPYLDKPFNGE